MKEFNIQWILCKYPFCSMFTFSSLVHSNHGALRFDCITLLHWGKKNLFVNVGVTLQNLPPQCLTVKPTDFRLLGKEFTNPLLVHTNIYT